LSSQSRELIKKGVQDIIARAKSNRDTTPLENDLKAWISRSYTKIAEAHDSGGKASLIRSDAPLFSLGQKYSRKKIASLIGGSEVDYLPTVDKRVVCGCFTLDCNPEAPSVIMPGTGKVIQREAKQFCR